MAEDNKLLEAAVEHDSRLQAQLKREEQDFQGWKADQTTRQVYQLMRQWRKVLMLQWSKKVFQREDALHTAEANAAALAQIELIEKFLELDNMQIAESLEEEIE